MYFVGYESDSEKRGVSDPEAEGARDKHIQRESWNVNSLLIRLSTGLMSSRRCRRESRPLNCRKENVGRKWQREVSPAFLLFFLFRIFFLSLFTFPSQLFFFPPRFLLFRLPTIHLSPDVCLSRSSHNPLPSIHLLLRACSACFRVRAPCAAPRAEPHRRRARAEAVLPEGRDCGDARREVASSHARLATLFFSHDDEPSVFCNRRLFRPETIIHQSEMDVIWKVFIRPERRGRARCIASYIAKGTH